MKLGDKTNETHLAKSKFYYYKEILGWYLLTFYTRLIHKYKILYKTYTKHIQDLYNNFYIETKFF